MHGSALPYPWTDTTADDANYAPANLGQLKRVFSFDLTNFDTDHDGVADAWELQNFGDLDRDTTTDTDEDGVSDIDEIAAGTDWNDFFNGAAPVLTIVSGNNQGDLVGHTLAVPLKVQLSNSAGVVAAAGSVTFAVTSSSGGSLSPTNPVSVDGQGMAQVSMTLPSDSSVIGTTITVAATTTNSFGSTTVVFNLSVGDPGLPPAKPGPLEVEMEHGSTVATVTWEDRSNNETAFYLERALNGQNWQRIGTLDPNTTSYSDSGLTPDEIYFYRVISHNDAP